MWVQVTQIRILPCNTPQVSLQPLLQPSQVAIWKFSCRTLNLCFLVCHDVSSECCYTSRLVRVYLPCFIGEKTEALFYSSTFLAIPFYHVYKEGKQAWLLCVGVGGEIWEDFQNSPFFLHLRAQHLEGLKSPSHVCKWYYCAICQAAHGQVQLWMRPDLVYTDLNIHFVLVWLNHAAFGYEGSRW